MLPWRMLVVCGDLDGAVGLDELLDELKGFVASSVVEYFNELRLE